MNSKLKSYCRFRGLNPQTTPQIYNLSIETSSFKIIRKKLNLCDFTMESKEIEYKFNRIYNEISQQELFQEIMKPLIRDAFLLSFIPFNL